MFMNWVLAFLLSIAVPLHQIPGRRLLMKTLWERSDRAHTVTSAAKVSPIHKLKRVGISFRHCRPCQIKRTIFFHPSLLAILGPATPELYRWTAHVFGNELLRGDNNPCRFHRARSPPRTTYL